MEFPNMRPGVSELFNCIKLMTAPQLNGNGECGLAVSIEIEYGKNVKSLSKFVIMN